MPTRCNPGGHTHVHTPQPRRPHTCPHTAIPTSRLTAAAHLDGGAQQVGGQEAQGQLAGALGVEQVHCVHNLCSMAQGVVLERCHARHTAARTACRAQGNFLGWMEGTVV